jgi:carbohydrate kinase (thermoresistant glucokinase family)
MKKVVFVMGVSGSGKTSVGRLLAKELSVLFVDADDHHPTSNIEKMSRGIPLNDADREPWLDKLNEIAQDHVNSGCVIACSALKEVYRKRLSESIESNVIWIYLKGTYDQIYGRMKERKGHFMGAKMLRSQFEALEEPENAIQMDIADSPEVLVDHIKSHLK